MTTPIPQPPGVPLLGNLFTIDPNNTWDSLRSLAEKYGEIFQINALGHKVVFVAGAALAEEICDEKRFRKYVGGPIVEIRAAVHDSLFAAFEEEASWGIAHRIMAPKLTGEAVAEAFEGMRETAMEFIGLWKGLSSSGDDNNSSSNNNIITPLEYLRRLDLENTTYVLLGKRLHSLDKDHPMIQAMEDTTSEAMKRPLRLGLLNWLVHGRKFKSSIATMRNFAAELVAFRRANPTERQDMLAAMLEHKDPETGVGLTESQVIDEVVTMPIGSSTVPCLLASTVYYLRQHPEVVARAREELDAVLGQGSEGITLDQLERLDYCRGIVRESLRLASPAPGFNIEPRPREGSDKSPVLLGGGKYEVAHDQAMIIVLAGVNRDPAVYEDPLVFRPERMVGEAFEGLPASAKKWFGNGKRVCVGQHFAFRYCHLMTALMIKELDFESVDGGYKPAIDGWFNIRLVDYKVRVKPRAQG